MGARIKNTTPELVPFALVLLEHRSFGPLLETSRLAQTVCFAAVALFREPVPPGPLDKAASLVGRAAGLAPLLAMGLVNTLYHAKAEDDLPRRDALLDELRALATTWPDDAAVREQLVRGLAKTMLDAAEEGDAERAARLRDELQELAEAHPHDAWVAEFRRLGLI